MGNTIKTLKSFSAALVVAIILFTTPNVQANEKALLAQYWTIENNVQDRTFTIVRFYNYQDRVVMERKIDGKYIKLNKRDIRRLNKELKAFNSQIKSEN